MNSQTKSKAWGGTIPSNKYTVLD